MSSLAALLRYLSHGVYVIGVSDGTRQNAFTAAWVMQASFDPPLLVISINPLHYSYTILQAGGICSVNVLASEQKAIAEHFGRSGQQDKMGGFQWIPAKSGAPILSSALVGFDCKIVACYPCGDHQLVVCEIAEAFLLHPGKPMLYAETGDMDKNDKLYRALST